MIRHYQRSPCVIRIFTNHRNMFSFSDKAKSQKSTTPDFAMLKSGASTELEVGCKVRVDIGGVDRCELSCSLLALIIYYSIRIINFFFLQMVQNMV
jgi:hypothetical protein